MALLAFLAGALVAGAMGQRLGARPLRHWLLAAALVETDRIGDGTRIWAFAHVMPGAVLGAGCNVGDHCFVESGVVIGDHCTIKNGVSIWQHVHLGNDVFVGPNAVFTNDLYPRNPAKTKGSDSRPPPLWSASLRGCLRKRPRVVS